MISLRAFIRSTAALCAIMTAGVILAEDGVVRMSDRSSNTAKSSNGTGVVRMSDQQGSGIQRTGHKSDPCGETNGPVQACSPQSCTALGAQNCNPVGDGTCDASGCNPNMSGNGCDSGCDTGMCQSGSCYTPMDCNNCFSSCDASGMPVCWCGKCQCSPCQCHDRQECGNNGICLFAGSMDSGTDSRCRDFWHGQSMSFRNKNARLSNHLFGWLIPSGFCGQGCPPVGKYKVTYADQPDYVDPRDTQIYGTQQYGMPISVPLAPNVNHTYNYSSGMPSSRISHIGTYNPNTSPRPLYHQTW